MNAMGTSRLSSITGDAPLHVVSSVSINATSSTNARIFPAIGANKSPKIIGMYLKIDFIRLKLHPINKVLDRPANTNVRLTHQPLMQKG